MESGGSGICVEPGGCRDGSGAGAALRGLIGPEDLVNSNGDALTAPWQVIRQDRANYHRFGIRHAGDQSDPLFHDPENRALMEQYVQQGRISPQAARDIMRGGATIVVHIFADVRIGQWVEIDVYR